MTFNNTNNDVLVVISVFNCALLNVIHSSYEYIYYALLIRSRYVDGRCFNSALLAYTTMRCTCDLSYHEVYMWSDSALHASLNALSA